MKSTWDEACLREGDNILTYIGYKRKVCDKYWSIVTHPGDDMRAEGYYFGWYFGNPHLHGKPVMMLDFDGDNIVWSSYLEARDAAYDLNVEMFKVDPTLEPKNMWWPIRIGDYYRLGDAALGLRPATVCPTTQNALNALEVIRAHG